MVMVTLTVTVTVMVSRSASATGTMDGRHQVAGGAKWVENDNDAEMGTNVGAVEGEMLSNYFVRWVYLCRYPTVSSHPRKLTS